MDGKSSQLTVNRFSMVATKLSEVAGKGWGWYASSEQPQSSPGHQNSSLSRRRSSIAKHRVISSDISSSSTPTRAQPDPEIDASTSSTSLSYYEAAQESFSEAWSSLFSGFASSSGKNREKSLSQDAHSMDSSSSSRNSSRRANLNAVDWNSSVLMSPTILKLFHNPYIGVRGPGRRDRAKPQQSMEAVRNLIYVVPLNDAKCGNDSDDEMVLDRSNHKQSSSSAPKSHSFPCLHSGWYKSIAQSVPFVLHSEQDKQATQQGPTNPSSSEETASQLAEGTLRAYRDLALDEAVELHASLQYWTNRWERPLLSWFEAGPIVWFAPQGYDHQVVGQKVSQIQAVLARRLSTIGELQQHLLKSGWQRGVAQWGFLGEGGEWAAISGTDGRMEDENALSSGRMRRNSFSDPDFPVDSSIGMPCTLHRGSSDQLLRHPTPVNYELPIPAPSSKTSSLPRRSQNHNQLYYTNLFVKKKDGGRILKDGTALAQWSVDAINLVRNQLSRAAQGQMYLPYAENWHERQQMNDEAGLYIQDGTKDLESQGEPIEDASFQESMPRWADVSSTKMTASICDLPLLVDEVSALLDVMEEIMGIQRARRLDKLKPPSWWRQNWFLTSVCAPLSCYILYNISIKRGGLELLRFLSKKVADFFQEHVIRPCFAIYHELTKGTEYFSDRAARDTAIATLKKMIRSWLDETYPEMLDVDKEELSEAMDMSLIEITKERNMKTIYELNSVIRMSFIEAQFIKKEMMNALVALDEMQASTNFNMNLAAITPFVLLVWFAKKISSFVFYTTFKWGKSRAETYSSFLHILTEIERLLIMRLNPPNTSATSTSILDSDDLGMLMLHLHELRTIMWNQRRRFSLDVLRSVSEDLAELSGERGAVSVRQQLYIVERMSRTYAFLKGGCDRQ